LENPYVLRTFRPLRLRSVPLNRSTYDVLTAPAAAWRGWPIEGTHAYVFLDGIWLKRSWGGEVRNVAILVAVGVNADGCREILGVMEGGKEDAAAWRKFVPHLKERGLSGVALVTSDKCLGRVEAVGEAFPGRWVSGTNGTSTP
jgi:transposase-like protein